MSAKKIIIASTPRSGNTWVNYCLADIIDAPSLGLHRHTDLDESDILEKMILQIHEAPSYPGFKEFISRNNFQVVTVVRHPLDVLISVLRFAQVQTSPLQWLDGTIQAEDILGLTPSDEKFIKWCLSKNAKKLLSVSYDWSNDPACQVIQYEELLKDPHKNLAYLLRQLGYKPSGAKIVKALKKYSPGFFSNNHSWKSTENNWVNFFTKKDAEEIYKEHKEIFEKFGYDVMSAKNEKRSDNMKSWDITRSVSLEQHTKKSIEDIEKQNKKAAIYAIRMKDELNRVNKHFSKLNKIKDKEISRLQKEVSEKEAEIAILKEQKDDYQLNKYIKKVSDMKSRLKQKNIKL